MQYFQRLIIFFVLVMLFSFGRPPLAPAFTPAELIPAGRIPAKLLEMTKLLSGNPENTFLLLQYTIRNAKAFAKDQQFGSPNSFRNNRRKFQSLTTYLQQNTIEPELTINSETLAILIATLPSDLQAKILKVNAEELMDGFTDLDLFEKLNSASAVRDTPEQTPLETFHTLYNEIARAHAALILTNNLSVGQEFSITVRQRNILRELIRTAKDWFTSRNYQVVRSVATKFDYPIEQMRQRSAVRTEAMSRNEGIVMITGTSLKLFREMLIDLTKMFEESKLKIPRTKRDSARNFIQQTRRSRKR